ncbi:putative lipoprotein YiaD precursor [Enhygromyxa salina]|uniref:Putative lipoprotein YiaD n=1 Tax=Enhygromyxa salina TaxID=215803 RepID=A0A2S9YCC3_9BACT|nr:OmpA family protein [Enhygromyxa salina]PRQ02778.1 putative lipoprotein YiaD precursor [Enhygromyxa salina]
MIARPTLVVGLLLFAALGAGCHGHAGAELSSPRYAPIYTDGPVPLPGEDFNIPHVTGIDGQPLVVASVPPGSLMAFPSTDTRPPSEILLRQHAVGGEIAADAQVWTAEPVLLPNRAPKRMGNVIGFEVPQLPHGLYDAWYVGGEPEGSGRVLLNPGAADASQWTTFEVRPQLEAAQSVIHALPGTVVDVAIALQGPAPAGQPTNITLSGFNQAVRLAIGQRAVVSTDANGVARFRVRVRLDSDVYLAASAPGFAPTAVRVVGGPEQPLRDHRLQPGDILLCQGNTLISPGIQVAERMQLGQPNRLGRPWYSHVALYLGDDQTAEMLSEGLVTHTLQDTVAGCTTLDVYRRDGITDEQQYWVVEKSKYWQVPYAWGQLAAIASMALVANDNRVRLDDSESWWDSFVAGLASTAGWVVRAVVTFVAGTDDGQMAMICSEFVAWSYHDGEAGLDVAPWWPVMENAELLSSLDGRMDFTTPNMIAQSPDLSFQFQLYPKVPAQIELADCQLRLGEKIEFATGSAVVDEHDEDLLKAIVEVLANQPEITKLRVEGNTDNVGAADRNLELSQARADAVVSWLVAHGVEASRLSAVGLGMSRPLGPNDSAGQRHRNRRVEFHVESMRCPLDGEGSDEASATRDTVKPR